MQCISFPLFSLLLTLLSSFPLGVWQKILTAVTLASVITNAFVIAISTNYLPRLVYAASNGNLKGYIDAAYTYSVAKDCYYEVCACLGGVPAECPACQYSAECSRVARVF